MCEDKSVSYSGWNSHLERFSKLLIGSLEHHLINKETLTKSHNEMKSKKASAVDEKASIQTSAREKGIYL